jgi:hypothetical protein
MKAPTYIASLLLAMTMTNIAWAQEVAAPYNGPGADIPMVVIRQNMVDDPNLLAQVAQAEGMTPARFMGQGEGRIMQQVRKYLAERSKPKTPAGAPSSARYFQTCFTEGRVARHQTLAPVPHRLHHRCPS